MNHWKLYAHFLKPHLKGTFILVSVYFIASIIEAISLGAMYPVVSAIMGNSPQAIDEGQAGKIVAIISNMRTYIPVDQTLVAACIVAIFFTILAFLLSFASGAISGFYKYKLYQLYLNQAYKSLFEKKYAYYTSKKQGEFIYLGIQAAESVGELFHFVPLTLVQLLNLSMIGLLLFSVSFQSTLLLGLVLISLGLFYMFISSKLSYPIARRVNTGFMSFTAFFSETVSGIKQIQIFQSFDFFIGKYSRIIRDFCRGSTKLVIIADFPSRFAKAMLVVGLLTAVIFFRQRENAEFTSAIPLLALYLMAIQRMLPAISLVGSSWMGLKHVTPKLEDFSKFLVEGIQDTRQDKPACPVIQNAIELKNLSFRYRDHLENVLDCINLKIEKNKTVALVGGSGAGKSTLSEIIIGTYPPSSGQILIDGNELCDYSLQSWMSKISLVTQEPFIFNMSVRDNIRMGNLSASDAEVEEVARTSFADEFIKTLESGYDTILGDRGVKLSGGQKQRIAIARALMKRPEVLLLDEATSALDNISEKVFQENLRKLSGKFTIIVIAHRLSTIENADNIVVLDKGKLLEQGNHQELIKRQGAYYKLYNKVFDQNIELT